MKWKKTRKLGLHFYVSPTIEFSALLNEWVSVQEDYLVFWPDDCCWWYTERPALSLLAAAVWRQGGVALEEFAWNKRASTECKGYPGRCDLGFGLGKGKNKTSYEAEAKHVWCDYDLGSERMIAKARTKLAQAYAAAKTLHKGENPLAILFVSFSVSKERRPNYERHDTTRDLKQFEEFITAFSDARASAILLSPNRANGQSPGCAVIICGPTPRRNRASATIKTNVKSV